MEKINHVQKPNLLNALRHLTNIIYFPLTIEYSNTLFLSLHSVENTQNYHKKGKWYSW